MVRKKSNAVKPIHKASLIPKIRLGNGLMMYHLFTLNKLKIRLNLLIFIFGLFFIIVVLKFCWVIVVDYILLLLF